MRIVVLTALLVTTALLGVDARRGAESFDVVIRNGTVIDGSGGTPFKADVATLGGRIARIGNLAGAEATTVVDATGLYVVPGFINIHSHASAEALSRAENMLTQGVTSEIVNADGGGPFDIRAHLDRLAAPGLALNVGAYVPFNTIWSTVVGATDRRPDPGDIDRMRGMIVDGLAAGGWGVSAGLDYKPAYFARTDEVIAVVSAAAPWHTNFTNHDRVVPETGFSSRAGMQETLKIAAATGTMPVITHMKVTGSERGTAASIVADLARATGGPAAADAYPYLAGQTQLGALIIPAWAQDGGRARMLERFADPQLRQRIARESEEVLSARFGGPANIFLPATRRQLADVMREFDAPAGETIIRLLEQGSPSAILHFGREEDLEEILRYRHTSIACDCGATTSTTTHPRNYGSYPRVLGRYVRERRVVSWPDAIRKMSSLPAATIGLVDRGTLAPGMAADITVLDPARVTDRATYEEPAVLSEGIRHVFVNGAHALKDGQVTGTQAGRPLFRSASMWSRRTSGSTLRPLRFRGAAGPYDVSADVSQPAAQRRPSGAVRVADRRSGTVVRLTEIGSVQSAGGWVSLSGIGRTGAGSLRALTLTITGGGGSDADAATVQLEPLGPPATIDDVVEAEMGKQRIPGAAVAVIRKDHPPMLRGYGLANVEHGAPVTPDTIFQSGSVGKQFTAAAAMLLVEDGKLSLGDALTRFFPAAPEPWKRITVRHLLTHTSGLPDYTAGTIDYRRDYTEEELLKFAYGLQLEFEPGARWNYSNTGYVVLGIVIRKASGQFYGDLLRDRLFATIGMKTARVISEADLVPHRAAGYRLVRGELKHQQWVAPQLNTTADGSLYVSLRDMVAWDAAIREGRLLKAATWQQIFTPVALNSGNPYPYGFGWDTADVAGRRAHRHGGSWQGFKTDIVRYQDDGTTIIVLANLAQADPGRISDGIAQVLSPGKRRVQTAPVENDAPAMQERVRRLIADGAAGRLAPDEFAYVRAGFFPGAANAVAEMLKGSGALSDITLLERTRLGDDQVSRYRLTFEKKRLRLRIAVAPDGKIAAFGLSPDQERP